MLIQKQTPREIEITVKSFIRAAKNVGNMEESLLQIKQNQFLEDFFFFFTIVMGNFTRKLVCKTRCHNFYINEGHYGDSNYGVWSEILIQDLTIRDV